MEAKCSRWSEKDGGGEEKRAVVVFITVKAPPPSSFPVPSRPPLARALRARVHLYIETHQRNTH